MLFRSPLQKAIGGQPDDPLRDRRRQHRPLRRHPRPSADIETDQVHAPDQPDPSLTVRGNVDNATGTLKAGSFIEVELTRQVPDAISIPLEAVQREGTEPFVFLHEEGDRFRRVPVRLGAESEGRVVVTEGLKPGQQLVAKGGFILKSELMKELIAGE